MLHARASGQRHGKHVGLQRPAQTIPAVNQVELHPFFAQEAALENMRAYGVRPQAWGPLAEGKHGIFTHSALAGIGERYGKSSAQVALRWNVQRGVSVIPKSVRRERMEENFDRIPEKSE